MNNPISPQSVYLIHKEKEEALERQIQWELAAKERGALKEDSFEFAAALKEWRVKAAQWVEGKFFSRARSHQKTIPEPCPGVPC